MSEFTNADAEAAGWSVVHQADPNPRPADAEIYRAEKYVSSPGRAGVFSEVQATSEEKLNEAIAMREQQFAVSDEGDVIVAKDDETEVDLSDDSTFERVSTAEIAAGSQNDSLLVLSDPEDPDSEPVQKVIHAGNEVDASVLSEPTAPSTNAEAETRESNESEIKAAIKERDDSQKGDEGDSGNDPEVVQPAAGEATDASDSEQQGQVPDSEAAESDKVGTNDPNDFLATNESQDEILGPDTDSEAPAPAPNATNAARKQADEAGIDLSEVEGSGKDGKVTAPDVQKHGEQ